MTIDRRTFLSAAGGAIAASALPASVAAREIAFPQELQAFEPVTVTAVATRQPVVAMTFDDGPHPTLTPRLLDILGQRGIRATFYVIGSRARRHPGLIRRIVAEGHEIGNHSWSHPYLNRRSTDAMFNEIDRTNQVVYDYTGLAPVTFRPPYGAFTQSQRRMLHEQRHMPTILWSVDPQDWRRPGSSVVTSRILLRSHPGAIILSHDIHAATIAAMPSTMDGLLSRGYEFATMSQMLGWPTWQTRRFQQLRLS